MAFQHPVTFINRTQRKHSRREEQLLCSFAKSHARRVSHESSKRRRIEAECVSHEHSKRRRFEATFVGGLNSPLKEQAPPVLWTWKELHIAGEPDTGVDGENGSTILGCSLKSCPKATTEHPDDPGAGAQHKHKPSSGLNCSWQWSKGFRVDPFNCVPWASKALAELDLCEDGSRFYNNAVTDTNECSDATRLAFARFHDGVFEPLVLLFWMVLRSSHT